MIPIIRSGLFTVAVMTLTVPAAAGANQADASEIALQWSVFEACGENMACRSAVELQFATSLKHAPLQCNFAGIGLVGARSRRDSQCHHCNHE